MTIVKGMSGASGKRRGAGVRRELHVEHVGGGDVTIVPAAPSRSRGLGVRVASAAVVAAFGNGRPVVLHGANLRGSGTHRFTLNRTPADGPHDDGRAYLWIASDGDRDGWDFLADDRDALFRALGS